MSEYRTSKQCPQPVVLAQGLREDRCAPSKRTFPHLAKDRPWKLLVDRIGVPMQRDVGAAWAIALKGEMRVAVADLN